MEKKKNSRLDYYLKGEKMIVSISLYTIILVLFLITLLLSFILKNNRKDYCEVSKNILRDLKDNSFLWKLDEDNPLTIKRDFYDSSQIWIDVETPTVYMVDAEQPIDSWAKNVTSLFEKQELRIIISNAKKLANKLIKETKVSKFPPIGWE